MSLELTDEERAFLRKYLPKEVDTPWPIITLGIILKLQAGKMKAEFKLVHVKCQEIDGGLWWKCISSPQDPCHTWTDDRL